MKKAIVIGAGPLNRLPDLSNSYLVCCDGGYKYLKEKGIEPDLLVGDFDTFPKEEIGHPKDIIALNPIKDDTDSFHAINVLLERGYTEFHLYGRYGGRRDQTRASLSLVSYLKDQKAYATLYSDDGKRKRIRIENETIVLSPMPHGFISVFSYLPLSRGVTIKGRKYSLENQDLTYSTSLGCSNELIGKEGYVSVREGRLAIIMPKEETWQKTERKSN